jgi:hypothetical protein
MAANEVNVGGCTRVPAKSRRVEALEMFPIGNIMRQFVKSKIGFEGAYKKGSFD